MGISEAYYIPAALALIADYHHASTRSRAVGLHQMAIYFGVISGGFSGYIAAAPELGWRSLIWNSGLFGMLYAIPLVSILRNAPAAREQDVKPVSRPSFPRAVSELLQNRSFLLLVGFFALPALAGWVVRDWMPAILKGQFQIGQGYAGVSATLYWQLAAILGEGGLTDG